jgi:hypothetical protein
MDDRLVNEGGQMIGIIRGLTLILGRGAILAIVYNLMLSICGTIIILVKQVQAYSR